MMWVWLQALGVLTLAFGLGLWLGGYLGRLALTEIQAKETPLAVPVGKPSPKDKAAVADYHGYEPEITPLLTPKTLEVHPAPPKAAKPVTEKPRNTLFFPVSSFGVMSETHKKQTPIISPLANLDTKALEEALASVTHPQEPVRLMGEQAQRDDLKRLEGIGPVNAQELNDLGIFYFWQIAAWSPEEVVWIAQHIHFPDRIVREHWIKQAANLLMHDEIA